MPHLIDTTTGQAACLTAGTPPWHGLGVNVEHAVSSAHAIRLARLDWNVQPWSLDALDPDGRLGRAAVTDHVANVRTDTRAVLGVVSKRYQVVQNAAAFDFMDALIGDGLARYETAGALRGGRQVWMLAKLPDDLHPTDDDVVKPYVLLTNSHDGTGALRMLPATVRVVCNNTLNLALGQASQGEGLVFRHRGRLDDRIDDARQRLGLISHAVGRFGSEVERLLRIQLTPRKIENYFRGVLPPPEHDATERQRNAHERRLNDFRATFEDSSNTLPGVRGTAWAAYNAISGTVDHPDPDSAAGRDGNRRLQRAWFGSGHRLKTRAFVHALELAALN